MKPEAHTVLLYDVTTEFSHIYIYIDKLYEISYTTASTPYLNPKPSKQFRTWARRCSKRQTLTLNLNLVLEPFPPKDHAQPSLESSFRKRPPKN